jgi:hypothetical protein
LTFFGMLSTRQAENDFPYLDRNNTYQGTMIDPTQDDTVRTMRNNRFLEYEFFIHPTAALPGARLLKSGVSAAFDDYHIPAPEGKENRTARYTEKRAHVSLFLDEEDKEDVLDVLPRIGYVYADGLTLWTGQDQGMGSTHGGVSQYGEVGIVEQALSGSCLLRWTPHGSVEFRPCVSARATDANPVADRDGTVHADWHGREVQGDGSVEVTGTLGPFGALCGASIRGVYSETEGGLEAMSNEEVPPSDTITVVWAVNGGLSWRPVPQVLFFGNGGRYSNEPSLRERYGSRGALMANPDLEPETGITVESGVKLDLNNAYLECTGFFVESKNTILLIRDGYQAKPANCNGAAVKGVELKAAGKVTGYAQLEINATYQQTENNDIRYRGKRLPDEPELTVVPGFELFPVKNVSLKYHAAFRSFYFHDAANTDQFRVPAIVEKGKEKYGTLFHDIQLVWEITGSLKCAVSGTDLTSTVFPSRAAPLIEGGYSWIVYPSNQWSVSMAYSF